MRQGEKFREREREEGLCISMAARDLCVKEKRETKRKQETKRQRVREKEKKLSQLLRHFLEFAIQRFKYVLHESQSLNFVTF